MGISTALDKIAGTDFDRQRERAKLKRDYAAKNV